MRTKLLVGVLLVIALILPLAVASAQGGSIGVNDMVEGTLNESLAEYGLTLAAGQTVSITLMSDDFDTYLQVKNAEGAVLVEDDDSAGNLNSALLFSAPLAGTYTLVVGAYGGRETIGAYTLTTSELTIVELAYDSSAKVLFDGTTPVLYFSFMGKQGDVIDLYTDNPDMDLRLYLYDPAGNEVAYDDDSGEGYAPLLRRVFLQTSGAYQVELRQYASDDTGVTQLVLEQTEAMMLDSGPQSVVLNDDLSSERFGLNVTEGSVYRVTLTSDVAANGGLEIMLDPEFYDTVSVNFSKITETSAVFTSTVSGVVSVELSDYSWAEDGVNYTLEAVIVE